MALLRMDGFDHYVVREPNAVPQAQLPYTPPPSLATIGDWDMNGKARLHTSWGFFASNWSVAEPLACGSIDWPLPDYTYGYATPPAWSNVGYGVVNMVGRHGGSAAGRGASSGYSAAGQWHYDLSPGDATCVVGFGFRDQYGFTGQLSILGIYAPPSVPTGWKGYGGAGDDLQCSLDVLADGSLAVYGASDTPLGKSSRVLRSAKWYFIEARFEIGNAGRVEVRVNGEPWITLINVDTQGTGIAGWGSVRVSDFLADCRRDDLYILDGTGPAPWNTFLGESRVDDHLPVANGTDRGWTPSSGTDDYAVLKHRPFWAGRVWDYEALHPPEEWVRVTGQLPVSVQKATLLHAGSTVLGVQVHSFVKRSDSGPCVVKQFLRIGGTRYYGAERTPPFLRWQYVVDVWPTNPATSAAWTESAFNAAEVGLERVR